MRTLLIVMALLILSSCATQQAPQEIPSSTPAPAPSPNKLSSTIDLEGLQHYLGFDSRPNELGYVERSFNTCEIGFGYSAIEKCHTAFFIQINFQLLCRLSDANTSISLKISDQIPMSGSQVNWKIEKYRGAVELDESGKGQIRFLSARSMSDERLKLGVGNDFVVQIAGEVDRILTPHQWCRSMSR